MPTVGNSLDIGAYRDQQREDLLTEFADLPPELLRIARDGYEYRDPAMEREEGILTPLTLQRALENFSALDTAERQRFMTIVSSFPDQECRIDAGETSPDFTVARALILKALAYHRGDVDALADFTARLYTLSARAMLNATTLIEIDGASNTDSREVSGMREEAANNPSSEIRFAMNDGANQSFWSSCVPAGILLYRGEMDPLFAITVRDDGFDAPLPDSVWTREQQRMLAESKLWRERAYQRPFYRINETLLHDGGIVGILNGLFATGTIPRDDFATLLLKLDYWAQVYCAPCLEKLRRRISEELQELPPVETSWLGKVGEHFRFGDPPPDIATLNLLDLIAPYERDILASLRERGFPEENDLDLAEIFDPAQFHTLGEPVGEAFTAFNTGDDFAGTASRPVAENERQLAELLADGQDVILSFNAHATLLCDVRDRGGKIEVYQADPADGTGRWIDVDAIKTGTFHYPLRECSE